MIITTAAEMEVWGRQLGAKLRGGEIIELIGDVGAGKTTLVRGIAQGLQITDPITSPSFTISCNYSGRSGLTLRHYDFYRLDDAGIMSIELAEALNDQHGITVIEWGDSVHSVLPSDHVTISICYLPDSGRQLIIHVPDHQSYLVD